MPSSSAAFTFTPPARSQRLGDVLALDVLDVLLEIEACVGKRPAAAAAAPPARRAAPDGESGRLSARIDGRALERDRPLDHVLELADVARPVVRLQAAPAPRREMPVTGFPICVANRARKCSASSGMSSRRSRSGGSATGMTLIR